MASLRWEQSAVGFVLDLSDRSQRRILNQVAHLREFPRLGVAAMPPFEGKRRLVVGPYSVVSECDAETDVMSVVAIAYGGPRFR